MKTISDHFFVRYKKRNKNILVTKKVDQYLLSLSNKKNELDDEFKKIAKLKNGSLQTPPNQLELIAVLAKSINAKNILEIGTYKGLSSLYLSKNLGPKVKITTCELIPENINDAKKLWLKHNTKNISIIEGNATETIKNLKSKYDLIYIDADKNNYPIYYDLCKKLVNKNGLLILDNMLWAGLVVNEKSGYSHAMILKKLNERIYKENSSVSLIPAWDGIMIINM